MVQLFTKAVDEVRRAEARQNKLPKALCWAVLKRADGRLTEAQVAALAELEASDLFTATASRIKEKLRWVRQAQSVQAARWRLTNFLRHANDLLDPDPLLDPVRKAIGTVEAHSQRILHRWTSAHSNARLEGLNGLFQVARARARGYRSVTTFRHHHLPDCRTAGRSIRIHLARRNPEDLGQRGRLPQSEGTKDPAVASVSGLLAGTGWQYEGWKRLRKAWLPLARKAWLPLAAIAGDAHPRHSQVRKFR